MWLARKKKKEDSLDFEQNEDNGRVKACREIFGSRGSKSNR